MTTRNQPTYDFLAGGTSPPQQSLRHTLRQSQAVRPDHGNEDLRAHINTLQYELDSLKQERELAALRHQKELRDVQAKAEADFRRAQVASFFLQLLLLEARKLIRTVYRLRKATRTRRPPNTMR